MRKSLGLVPFIIIGYSLSNFSTACRFCLSPAHVRITFTDIILLFYCSTNPGDAIKYFSFWKKTLQRVSSLGSLSSRVFCTDPNRPLRRTGIYPNIFSYLYVLQLLLGDFENDLNHVQVAIYQEKVCIMVVWCRTFTSCHGS